MGPLSPNDARTVLVVAVSLVAAAGLVVGIVLKVLSAYRWLQSEFAQVTGALTALQSGIAERFARHEEDERQWQADLNAKVEDMRERLARMEGQLAASADERNRRSRRDADEGRG